MGPIGPVLERIDPLLATPIDLAPGEVPSGLSTMVFQDCHAKGPKVPKIKKEDDGAR